MAAFFFSVTFAGILVVTMQLAGILRAKSYFPHVVVGGYVLRLLLQLFLREVQLFSHDSGGDYVLYELCARVIAQLWDRDTFHYVTSDELPELGATSLPANLFAGIIYFCDGVGDRTACTALVALSAGLTAVNIYLLAVRFGAEPKNASLYAIVFYLQPSFLYYTCDMFKDGLVLCLTLGALGSALRLGQKFSVVDTVLGLVCLLGLWYVRFYLVFVTAMPIVVGLIGLSDRRDNLRSMLAAVLLAFALIGVAIYTDLLQLVTARGTETFEIGTSQVVLQDNGSYGSGVLFDDGGVPYRALPQKLAYTIFSPFPWSPGSFGFQLGKLDALVWYFVVYRAVQAARQIDRRLLLMLLTFIAPCTIMYAMSMSNVGLIVRQRLTIVAATVVLAALFVPKRSTATNDDDRSRKFLQRAA